MSVADEKRHFKRYKCSCKVSFSNEGTPCSATLLDYSLSGICAVVEDEGQVSVGNIIYLDSKSPEIHDSGVVVWKKKSDDGLIVGIDRIGPISGALSDYRFSDVLIGLNEIKASGTLDVVSGKAVKKIYLKDGLISFAVSNLRTEGFLFLLLQEGKITKQDYDSFISAEVARGKSVNAMLVEKGVLKPGESTLLLERQVEKIVKGVFLMDSGTFHFKDSPLPSDRSLRLPLNPFDLAYKSIMDITDSKLLDKYCPPTSAIVSLSGKAERLMSGKSSIEGPARDLVSLIDGRKNMKELIEASHSPVEEALKHLCALYGAGVITYRFPEMPHEKSEAQKDADSRRKHKRFDVECDVLINNSIKCRGINMSEGGVYVHTGRAFKKGSTVPISLLLDKKTLTIKTRVQRSEEGVGMGLMFIELMEWQKSLIQDYIDSALEETDVKSRKTILLVDDSETTRKMKKSKLVLDGFDVIEAGDGIEALKVLKEKKIGAVVLDLFMEKMDGFKVLSIIRQTPELKKLPVFILSGKSTRDYIEKARALGATDFLPKMTTSPARLSEMIKKYTERGD